MRIGAHLLSKAAPRGYQDETLASREDRRPLQLVPVVLVSDVSGVHCLSIAVCMSAYLSVRGCLSARRSVCWSVGLHDIVSTTLHGAYLSVSRLSISICIYLCGLSVSVDRRLST